MAQTGTSRSFGRCEQPVRPGHCARSGSGLLLLGVVLAAGCAKEKPAAVTPPSGGHGRHRRRARRPRLRRVHRPDPELAPGQHPGPGERIPRAAGLHGGRVRPRGRRPLPDGQEAVPGPGGRRGGGARPAAGLARDRAAEPRADAPARGGERPLAEGPRGCDGPLRVDGGERGAGEGRARRLPAEPLVLHDHVPGHGGHLVRPSSRTAPTSARRTAS